MRTSKEIAAAKDIMNKSIEDGGDIFSYEDALIKTGSSKDIDIAEVYPSAIKDEFYKALAKIQININNRFNKEKIIENKGKKKSPSLIIMMIIIWVLINIKPAMLMDNGVQTIIVLTLIAFMGFVFLCFFGFSVPKIKFEDEKRTKSTEILMRWFGLFFGIGSIVILFSMMIGDYLIRNPYQLIAYVIGVSIMAFLMAFIVYMPKRTEFGAEMLESTAGFINFIKSASKDDIEKLLIDNPMYMYEILPYAYSLNIYDEWLYKFKEINVVELPTWFEVNSNYDKNMITTDITDMLKLYSDIMISGTNNVNR